MSAAETLPANLPAPLKKILILLLSTAIGAAAGTGLVRLMGRLHMPTRSLTAFDVIALAIAVTFLAMAAVIALTSASRKQLARQMEGDEARLPATLEEVRSYRRQALSLALAGCMLLAPIFASHASRAAAIGIFAGVVCLFGAQTWINVHIWRTSDEFIRGLMLTIGSLTFAIGQGMLFLYAAAEHLHLVPAISSWGVIVLLLFVYLVANSAVTLRQHR